MDNVKEWTSLPMPELITRASCRKDWKRVSAESSQQTHEEVDFVPHPVVGLMLQVGDLVLQVGDPERISHALGFEGLDSFFFLFFRVSRQGPCCTAIEKDGSDKRLVELEPASEAEGVAPPGPV